jgi:MFS family permease
MAIETETTRRGIFSNKAAHRALIGSWFGTALESYDFLLFGSVAGLVFAKLFFPGADPLAGTLLAFGAFAVGFVARPIGGIIIGNYGDRIGRKPMLLLTLGLMGLVTALIGLLPTYAQIGIFAPILLTLLRFIQGIAYGGEWGGAVLLVVEHAPADRRGLYGGCANSSAPMGNVLASVLIGLSLYATGDSFFTWGWRIPFLFSLVMVAIGLYVRTGILETPEFLALKQEGRQSKVPVLEALRGNYREVLLTAGAFLLSNGSFYVTYVFVLTYGGITLGLGINTMLNALLVASVVMIFACVGFGALSDRIGRAPVILGSAVLTALNAFPLFWLLQTKDPTLVTLAVVLAAIAIAAVWGPVAVFITEIFGTRVRYSGASLGYQIGSIFGGGLSPLIATALLKQSGGQTWPISLYIVAMAAIAFVCVAFLGETYKKPAYASAD